MWPFKPKAKSEPAKDYCIEYKNEQFNVGKTAILVELMDGTQVTIVVRGCVDQYINRRDFDRDSRRSPFIENVRIQSSKERALEIISGLNHYQNGICDYRDETVRYFSPPKKATIAWSEDLTEYFMVAYAVKKIRE